MRSAYLEVSGTDKTPKRRIMVFDGPDVLGRAAAMVVTLELRRNPRAVLALPTGKTPLPMYRWLVRLHRQGKVDFSAVTTFNLDEFYGVQPDNPGSFAAYMHREFFRHVNLRPGKVHLLNPLAQDVEAECSRYEREIRRAGGVDLAVLGIGRNGHIAFNEPGSPFSSRTRLVPLTAQTIDDNSRLFPDPCSTPRSALTMGIATIMEAHRVLLLAAGPKKARIVARALQGEVTTAVPASVLQRHPDLTVILDEDAAAGLVQPIHSLRSVQA